MKPRARRIDEAIAAYDAGKLTKEQADKLAISRGWRRLAFFVH
jgi:hypothetical protein